MKMKFSQVLLALAAFAMVGGAIGAGVVANGQVEAPAEAATAITSPYSYSFPTSGSNPYLTKGGTITLGGIAWEYTSTEYIGYSTGGLQIGSKGNPQTGGWTISTPVSSFGSGMAVKKVTVNAKTSGEGTVEVTCNDESVVASSALTTTSADYTNATDVNIGAGNLVIKLVGTSKALNLGSIEVKFGLFSSEPAVYLSKTAVDCHPGFADFLTATYANITGDVSYAWESSNKKAVDLMMDPSDNSQAIMGAAAPGSSTITVTLTYETSKTVSATCLVNVTGPISVKEALALAEGSEVYLGGYVATADYGSNSYSKFDLVDADAAANTNGTTSILLYNSSKVSDIAQGDYVVVTGTTKTYSGTKELNGFTLNIIEHSAKLLAAFINGSSTESQCGFKFPIAKAHYLAMIESEQNSFKSNAAYDEAQARYEAWASNQGQKPYEAGAQSSNFINFSDGNQGLVILISFLAIGVVAGFMTFFIAKKKRKA